MMRPEKTATYMGAPSVCDLHGRHWRVGSSLYKLSEPTKYLTLAWDPENGGHEVELETDHVVVSRSDVLGEETFIFPATQSGLCLDWMELDGSMEGTHEDADVLMGLGYTVARDGLAE